MSLWENVLVLIVGGLAGFSGKEIYRYLFRKLEIVDIQLNEARGQINSVDVIFRNHSSVSVVIHEVSFHFEHSEDIFFDSVPCSYLTIDSENQIRINAETKYETLPLTILIEPNSASRIRVNIISSNEFITIFRSIFKFNKTKSISSESVAVSFYPDGHPIASRPISDRAYNLLTAVKFQTNSVYKLYKQAKSQKDGITSATWTGGTS
jgi:hypothetical protein